MIVFFPELRHHHLHSRQRHHLAAIRFLEDMDCAILSGYREIAPLGLDGGEDGERGENLVRRKGGDVEILQSSDQTRLAAGDTIIIKTPTGGGLGKA